VFSEIWAAYDQGYILLSDQTTNSNLEVQKVHSILQYKLRENTGCCTPGIYQFEGQENISQNECSKVRKRAAEYEVLAIKLQWYSTGDQHEISLEFSAHHADYG